MWNLQAKLIY